VARTILRISMQREIWQQDAKAGGQLADDGLPFPVGQPERMK